MRRQWSVLYRALAEIGYPPPVTEDMEMWQAADLLGAGDQKPIIVGSRGVSLKSDDDEAARKSGRPPKLDPTKAAKRRKDPTQAGSSITGEDW